MNPDFLAAAVHTEPTEANMVRLLDEWSLKWKQKGRARAVGLGAYEKYCTPGLYAHGGTSGISRASNDENACSHQSFFESQISGQDVDFHRDSLQSENGTSSRSSKLERTSKSRSRLELIYRRSSLGRR